MGRCPITHSPTHAPPPKHLPYHFRRLSVDCWLSLSICGHLRTRPSPSLCFLMGLFSETQTGKPAIAPPNPTTSTLRGTIGIGNAIGWGNRCSTHGDRGAKPLEGRALADHYCGSLFLVFCCCGSLLPYVDLYQK